MVRPGSLLYLATAGHSANRSLCRRTNSSTDSAGWPVISSTAVVMRSYRFSRCSTGHCEEMLIDVRPEPGGCEHSLGPILRRGCRRRTLVGPVHGRTLRRRHSCPATWARSARGPGRDIGPGSVTIVATTRATSLTAIGEVRPVPKGSRMVPLSAIERAAAVVNNGLSKKRVGRTCTTGSPDQFSTCSDSQCSRWWCDSLMLSASIWDTLICERDTSAAHAADSPAGASHQDETRLSHPPPPCKLPS